MAIAWTALAALWPGFSSTICRASSSSFELVRSSTWVCASMSPGSRLVPGRYQHRPAVRRGPGDAGDQPVLDEHHRAVRPGAGPRVEHPVAGDRET